MELNHPIETRKENFNEKQFTQLLEKISGNIKRLRAGHGLTQEEMSKYGFNYRFYQKLESGRHSPSLKTLYRLAKAFNTDIQGLIQ